MGAYEDAYDNLMSLGTDDPEKAKAAKAAEAKRKKEFRVELIEDKKIFDAMAKREYCVRCHSRHVSVRYTCEVSVKIGVLPITRWLCGDCDAGLSRYLKEINEARREAERPAKEAAMAERKRVLDEDLAERRSKLNQSRAASGLPPLPPAKPSKPSKPKKTTARRKPKPSV
jgi:hypothetical protein